MLIMYLYTTCLNIYYKKKNPPSKLVKTIIKKIIGTPIFSIIQNMDVKETRNGSRNHIHSPQGSKEGEKENHPFKTYHTPRSYLLQCIKGCSIVWKEWRIRRTQENGLNDIYPCPRACKTRDVGIHGLAVVDADDTRY